MKHFRIIIILLVFFLFAFYYFNRQASFSHGTGGDFKKFEVSEGEGVTKIAGKLKGEGLITKEIYFNYYVWKKNLKSKLQAGDYELRASMTVPEIVQVLTLGEIVPNEIRVTFPEGTNVEKMAQILAEKGFEGKAFLERARSGASGEATYEFLSSLPKGAGLEGFLFPDTYIFFNEATAEAIVSRMLDNFDEKFSASMREKSRTDDRTVFEIVTLASILEKEVRSEEDMKIASGVFWKRIEEGRPLQSCATIAYVLGKEKKQYSFEDTRVESPYNTYLNKGLPPGPINNPGLKSISAALYPKETEYNYFLTDPETGKTVFSKTIEEHETNKVKYGL